MSWFYNAESTTSTTTTTTAAGPWLRTPPKLPPPAYSTEPQPSMNATYWVPNLVYNGSMHNWTYFNGSWYNISGYDITGHNMTIFTLNTSTVGSTPPTTRTTTTTTPLTPSTIPKTTTEWPYYFPTPQSPYDPGVLNCSEGGIKNRMYELRGILHLRFPRLSIFDYKNLNKTVTLDYNQRYFEGPIHYGLIMVSMAVIALILVLAYLLVIRCWGLTYPFKTMGTLRVGLVAVSLMIIFLCIFGLCGHLLFWHCYHRLNVDFMRPAEKYTRFFVERVEDCVESIFNYTSELELKLRFIKASQEGEINPYLEPDDVSTTTTVGPDLTKDMQEGGWSAVYNRIAGTVQDTAANLWRDVGNQIAATVWGITNDLKLMAAGALVYLMGQIYEQMKLLEIPVRSFLGDLKVVLSFMHIIDIIDYSLIFGGCFFYLYMIFICVCMINTTVKKKNTKMRCLSKFCFFMMVLWWLISILIFPVTVIWVDLCFDPARALSHLLEEAVKQLDTRDTSADSQADLPINAELIYHYFTCEGDDPFTMKMRTVILGLGYVLRALGTLLSGIQSFGPNSERVANVEYGTTVMMKIQHAQLEIFRTITTGCTVTAKVFHETMIELCNPCLMGLIVLATIAPLIAMLFLAFTLMSLRLKNFIGLPVPGMNWKKYNAMRKKKELKRLEKVKKKMAKQEKRDNSLREQMAERMLKKAREAERQIRLQPLRLKQKKRKLLMEKRMREIKRLKKLAACFCVPPQWAIRKCPEECENVPSDLPPPTDPRQRQFELLEKIRQDEREEKLEMKEELVNLTSEIDQEDQEAKAEKKKQKALEKEKKKKKKLLKKQKKKRRDDSDGKYYDDDDDESDDEEDLASTCDPQCRGVDKLRAMRELLKLKKIKARTRQRSRKTKNPMECAEEDCLRSDHAKQKLTEALRTQASTVDLDCGCKFPTKELKKVNRGWKLPPIK